MLKVQLIANKRQRPIRNCTNTKTNKKIFLKIHVYLNRLIKICKTPFGS